MSKEDTSRLRILVAIAVVALIGFGAVRMVLAHRTPEEKLADRWLEAVLKGDEKTAIEIANKLAPGEHEKIVHVAYKEVFAHERIPLTFLTGKFNSHDFRAWSEAAFFHQKASGKTIKQLFDLVTRQIKPVEPITVNGWPREIWERRFGLCDRMCWVMSELAYQQGSETSMVYLRDEKGGGSPHTLVEIRSGPVVWVADPLKGKIAHGRCVERIASDPKAVAQMWPENKHWQESLKHSMLYTPSAPSDYCSRNQELRKVLQDLLREKCPRFGEDPRERQLRVVELRKREIGNGTRFAMTIWNHPLRLLYRDMLQTGEVKATGEPKPGPKVEQPDDKPANAPTESN